MKSLPPEWDFDSLEADFLAKHPTEDEVWLCTNCKEAPSFTGFDTCLECSVAVALVEEPDFIHKAESRMSARDYARFAAEWSRQLDAIVSVAREVA